MSRPEIVVSKDGKENPKQTVVVTEMDAEYPNSIPFDQFGKWVEVFKPYKDGDIVTVSFGITSNEYNGRNYAKIKARKCEGQKTAREMITEVSETKPSNPETKDDLPF